MIPTAGELVVRMQAMVDQTMEAAAEAGQRAARLRTGIAGSILRLSERRGIVLDAEQRARITAEADVDRLTRWLDRCLEAKSAPEIFADG